MAKKMRIRIGIREQLATLGLLAVLVGLAVIAIPTWQFVHGFVRDVKTEGLAETASLKAAELASHLVLLQSTTSSISTRLIVQQTLNSFHNGNISEPQRTLAVDTLQTALLTSGFIDLLQGQVFASDSQGTFTSLINTTKEAMRDVPLPELYPNGSHVLLGDSPRGYPPSLYPNLTYPAEDFSADGTVNTNNNDAEAFPGVPVTPYRPLLLGPVIINNSYALISLTQPIKSIDGRNNTLGYITILAAATSLFRIQLSPEGLGQSGETLVLGPATPWNRFRGDVEIANGTEPGNVTALDKTWVHFVLPPLTLDGEESRHSDKASEGQPFLLEASPAAVRALAHNDGSVNNASALLDTHNEAGIQVAVGYARPPTTLVDWVVMVEQSHSEAFAPIFQLQKILLGCSLGTIAFVLIVIFPCAHYSVRPIRRLKAATEAATLPPGFKDDLEMQALNGHASDKRLSREGLAARTKEKTRQLVRWLSRYARGPGALQSSSSAPPKHHTFRIPARVADRKHFVTDELTELTSTFNEMSDELYVQYTHLEEKVAERTKELELSKKAAEAANESKTLFLANISHELKTPLNGILGLCTTCMEDDDLQSVRRELKTMYESGNLLLRLLEDLLIFSRNQVSTSNQQQQDQREVALEEEEFRLEEVGNQIQALFAKAARERDVDLRVRYAELPPAFEEWMREDSGVDRTTTMATTIPRPPPPALKDVTLVADQHRILQVLLNLVNNGLKFTGEGGRVEVLIRCLGFAQHGSTASTATAMTKPVERESSPSNKRRRFSGLSGRSSLDNGSAGFNNGTTTGGGGGAGGRLLGSLRRQVLEKTTTQETTTSPAGSGTTANTNGTTTTATAVGRSSDDLSRCGRVDGGGDSVRSATTEARPWLFEFVVEDNGVGIPETLQDKVFEPFVQGDARLSKRTGGAGLGLAICRQLATIMGGSISLTSAPGVGTSVCVHVPLKVSTASSLEAQPFAESGAAAEVPPGEKGVVLTEMALPLPVVDDHHGDRGRGPTVGNGVPTPIEERDEPLPSMTTPDVAGADTNPLDELGMQPWRDLRVLVAEDNEVNVNVVLKMLKLEKVLNVTVARDGQEALELVEERRGREDEFDIILMDILMPRLDGLQSTERIRKLGFGAPIVALTASAEGDIVNQGMAVGMNSFLGKPIRRAALKKVLAECIALIATDGSTGVKAG